MNTPATLPQTDQRNYKRQGHVALLLANIAWGLMSPVTKNIILQGQISPLALSGIRIGLSALLFLLAGMILPPSVAPKERIERCDYLKVFLASVLMISANQGLFILGVGYTDPIDSSVMSSTTPIITMILAGVILGYPITKFKLAGVILGLCGVILLVSGNRSSEIASNAFLGDSLCLAAQICAAVYYVALMGLTKRYAPFTLMKWMFLLSAVTYVPCCTPELAKVPWAELGVETWCQLAFIVIFATCVSYLALPFSQRRLKPTVVSAYNYLQPVVAAVAAVILGVGEFGMTKLIATAMIFAAVHYINKGSKT